MLENNKNRGSRIIVILKFHEPFKVQNLSCKTKFYLNENKLLIQAMITTMFTLYRIAFAPAPKSYQISPLFTEKMGDFGAFLVWERSQSGDSHNRQVFRLYLIAFFVPVQCEYSLSLALKLKLGVNRKCLIDC